MSPVGRDADSARRSAQRRSSDSWREPSKWKRDGIFNLVNAVLSVPPHTVVYFDDSPASTAGAQAAGWDAHLWTSHEETLTVLSEFDLLRTP